MTELIGIESEPPSIFAVRSVRRVLPSTTRNCGFKRGERNRARRIISFTQIQLIALYRSACKLWFG